MKKTLAALVLTSLSFSSFSATTDELLLKGTVNPFLSIDVLPETISTTLDLSTSQSDLLVAQVRERANVNAGYKVTVTSANQGKLVNALDSNHSVSYSLKYNASAIELIAPAAGNNEISYSTKQLAPIDRAITISYTGQLESDMLAGEYSDTVTFTIAAN